MTPKNRDKGKAGSPQEMKDVELFRQDVEWLEGNVCEGSIAEKVHKMIEDYRKYLTSKAVEIPKEETQKWGGWQTPKKD